MQPLSLSVFSYLDLSKNTVSKITWGPIITCDLGYWKTSTSCAGNSKPWGLNSIVNYAAAAGGSPEVKGSLRAWHFLGD